MRATPILLAAGIGFASSACFTAEFSPELSGVYACESDDECAQGEACADARCRVVGDLPRVSLVEDPDTAPRVFEKLNSTVTLTLAGELDVTQKGSDVEFGEGYFEVKLDDIVLAEIDNQALDGFSLDFPVQSDAPIQRLAVTLFRADGTPYTHEGAKATGLVVSETLQEAAISIITPWPGDTVTPENGTIEVEVRTFNFDPQLIDADKDGEPDGAVGDGHIHVYNDNALPSCAVGNTCSLSVDTYRPFTSESGVLPVPAGVEQLTVGALLVNALHCPYVDVEDALSDCDGSDNPIFDQIVVNVAPAEDD